MATSPVAYPRPVRENEPRSSGDCWGALMPGASGRSPVVTLAPGVAQALEGLERVYRAHAMAALVQRFDAPPDLPNPRATCPAGVPVSARGRRAVGNALRRWQSARGDALSIRRDGFSELDSYRRHRRGSRYGGRDPRAHDPPIEQRDLAIRVLHIARVVRDHADGAAVAVQLLQQCHHRLAVP